MYTIQCIAFNSKCEKPKLLATKFVAGESIFIESVLRQNYTKTLIQLAKIQKEHLQLHYAIAARLLMIIIANENKRSFQLLWHSPKSTAGQSRTYSAAGLPTEKSEMVCCFKNCPDQLFDIVIEKNFENEAKLTIYKILKSLE